MNPATSRPTTAAKPRRSQAAPSTRRFDRRVRLWGYSILRAAGIHDDDAHQSLQLLNNAVTRGLTVEYIRNPNKVVIERSIRVWKAQLLDLLFGPQNDGKT
jgi:hypothetical protein